MGCMYSGGIVDMYVRVFRQWVTLIYHGGGGGGPSPPAYLPPELSQSGYCDIWEKREE